MRPALAVLLAASTVMLAGVTAAGSTPASAADACPPSAAADSVAREVSLSVRTVPAAGTRIAYAEAGTGPALLLLNGTGSPMAEWDPALIAALARDRRVVVFDYPGLGRSGPAPGHITIPTMADWTASLVDALALDRPDVLGWSMGGFVAQQLAVRHPASIGRLVLAATNPGGPQAVLGPPWVQAADSDPDGSLATYLRTNYPRRPCAQAAGRAFIERLEAAADDGRWPVESVPARTYDAMVAAEDPWLSSWANLRSLAWLATPTLVMTGASDVITPPRNSRIIAAAIPGATLRLVAGAGHSFLFQDPLGTAETVVSFLRRP